MHLNTRVYFETGGCLIPEDWWPDTVLPSMSAGATLPGLDLDLPLLAQDRVSICFSHCKAEIIIMTWYIYDTDRIYLALRTVLAHMCHVSV
jgi:hypothetical protein